MYTELILGAEIKESAPEFVINALKYMTGQLSDKPDDFPEELNDCDHILHCASEYFAVNFPQKYFNNNNGWRICTRSNCKNYHNQIETFLKWLKPYVEGGSGRKEFYAIVIYEEDAEPTIYYLNETY